MQRQTTLNMETEMETNVELQTSHNEHNEYKEDNPAGHQQIEDKLKDIDINNPKRKLIDSKISHNSSHIHHKREIDSCASCCMSLKESLSNCGDSDCCQYLKYLVCLDTPQVYDQSKLSRIYIRHSQIRLIHVWLFGIAAIVVGNTVSFGWPQEVAEAVFLIMLVLAFAILLFNIGCVIKRNEGSCWGIPYRGINSTFGIPYPETNNNYHQDIDALFDLDRRKWGFKYLVCILLCSINELLIYSYFYLHQIEWDNCDNPRALNRDLDFAGKCAVNKSSISQAYIFVGAIIISISSYYRIGKTYVNDMNNYINDNGDNKYHKLTPKIIELKNEIQVKLQAGWKNKMLLENRVLEIIVTGIVCFLFHVVIYGWFRNNIFQPHFLNLNPLHIVACFWFYLMDSIMLQIGVSILFQIVYHYQFPSKILEYLTLQFKSDNINDIVSWWQLRKYYIECIIDIYGSGVESVIGLGLLGFVSLSIAAFTWDKSNDDRLLVVEIFYGFAILIVTFTLSLTTSAVKVYTGQLGHIYTLNKERLRLEYIECDHINKYENIFQRIVKDVKDNVKPMMVFGVKMVPEFLIFLKTTAVAVFIAAIRLYVFKDKDIPDQ